MTDAAACFIQIGYTGVWVPLGFPSTSADRNVRRIWAGLLRLGSRWQPWLLRLPKYMKTFCRLVDRPCYISIISFAQAHASLYPLLI